MSLDRATSRRLLNLLHPGNRFRLMFGVPLNEGDADVQAFRAECARRRLQAPATAPRLSRATRQCKSC